MSDCVFVNPDEAHDFLNSFQEGNLNQNLNINNASEIFYQSNLDRDLILMDDGSQ